MFRARLSSAGAPAETAQAIAASQTSRDSAHRPSPMSAPPSEASTLARSGVGGSAGTSRTASSCECERGRSVAEVPLEVADPRMEQACGHGIERRIHHRQRRPRQLQRSLELARQVRVVGGPAREGDPPSGVSCRPRDPRLEIERTLEVAVGVRVGVTRPPPRQRR